MARLLLIFCLIFGISCQTKRLGGSTEACSTLGIVKDYSNLDGCGLLIELADGTLLLPASLPENAQLKAEQRIQFGYRELNDAVSICMAERKVVDIVCIQKQ